MVRRTLVWMTVALLAGVGAAYAQTVAIAQISGVVTDESGGALPGVEVQVTQTDTGATRFVVSGGRGEYVLNNLPVGPYTLVAKLQGFSSYEQKGIRLTVGANPVINVTLKLSAVEETITVNANATMVETRNTAVGTVTTQEQMVGLPLNGRQPSQLIMLSGPAVDTGTTGAIIGSQRQYPTAVAFSVAGGTNNSTLYLVDGGYNNDPLNNIGQPMPFPDALQEFKVETGVRPARYGVYTGATVNAVTRSGANTFHGSAFIFGRNHNFNSRGFFDIQDDGLVRAQSGGTIGGPLIKNKLFFFGGPQITNERQRPTSSDTFVPTAKMLAGDFTDVMSAACQGGTSRTLGGAFVGNKVNPALFSPIALKIAALLPQTDNPCGRLSYTLPNDSNEEQGIGRIDYQMSGTQRIFGRYYIANYTREPAYDGKNVLLATGTGLGLHDRVQTFASGHDWVASPNLVASTRFSFQRSSVLRLQGSTLPTWSGLGANVYTYTKGSGQDFYNLSVTNGWSGPAFPGTFIATTPQVSEDVDWVKGAHSFSFGGMWMRPFEDADGPFQANGNFQFNGTRSGGTTALDRNGIADFLLGLPSQFSQGGSQIVAEKMHYVGVYAQDVWRASGRVTLNVGIRWEPYLAAKDQNGFTMAFNQDWFNQNRHSQTFVNAPAGLMFAGDPGFPSNGANTANRYNQFAPRAGIVWDTKGDGTQTIRAASGLYYDSPKLWQYGHHMLNPPFGNTVAVINPPSIADPWASQPGGNPLPVPSPIPSTVAFPQFGTYVSMPVDIHPMQVVQWNIAYERQLMTDLMVSATYLGNRTTHIWNGIELNPAVYIPGASTQGNVNQRRALVLQNPSQGSYYGSLVQTDDGGYGHYNGLMLTLAKRLTHGWSVNSNFTWGRCLNNGEPSTDIGNTYPDPTNRDTNWGPCDADRKFISNTSVILQSRPVGSGFVHVLTADWQLGTVFQARTGDPLTPTTTGNNSLTGLNNQRPIIVGDAGLSDPTYLKWFNTAAFAANTPGVWGNTPRGYLRGPGFWTVDMALSRNVPIGAQHIELRVEAFNVFNHVNYADPNVTFGNANFGRITAISGGPRIMQFAAKFVF